MLLESICRNVALDESNNGNFPVIYVQVNSNKPYDIIEQQELLPKKRTHGRKSEGIAERLRERDYTFLLFLRDYKDFIESHKQKGILLASLIYGKNFEDYLKIYIDGDMREIERNFAIDILHDITGLEKDSIVIFNGKDFDRKYNLVNIADETAHWLLQKSLESLRKNFHKREMMLKEFYNYLRK